jgi:ferritin-like metal-binding protein YciE
MTTAQQVHTALEEKVIDYLQDCHAMEQNVLRMLDSMIATTSDSEVLHQLKRHRMDTERHEHMLRERLEALGSCPSLMAEVPAVFTAWLKGLGDRLRGDKPGKNARDGYITEHVEIAAYSLLEQLADRAGDLETARVARFIREDEEEMAQWIASRWGRFIDLTLEEGGYDRRAGGRQPPWRTAPAGWRPRGQNQGMAITPLECVALVGGLTLVGLLLSQWRHLGGEQPRRAMAPGAQAASPG